jgi:hypothetical protein
MLSARSWHAIWFFESVYFQGILLTLCHCRGMILLYVIEITCMFSACIDIPNMFLEDKGVCLPYPRDFAGLAIDFMSSPVYNTSDFFSSNLFTKVL